MADYIFDREVTTLIVIRVPKRLWDRWEYRHKHYGKAIHAIRESVIQIMAAGVVKSWSSHTDNGDPFYTLEPRGE